MAPAAESTIIRPQLIVGLGNPGPKYVGTRHNVGFDVIEQLSERWQISLKQDRRFQGELGDGSWGGQRIRLLKPLTYMNRSGQSIQAVTRWLKLSPEAVLVIYDDMDLPVGRLRLRLSGSAGGHNGMKSAISHLGGQNFPRLRIGIGSTRQEGERDGAVVSHVLGRFSREEQLQVNQVIDYAIDAVEASLVSGVEKAMSLYNGQAAAS